MSDGLELDSLRCFEAAATTLNFRAAATRVHLSPAAFSDRLKRLEEELGAALFARTTRKVTLTPTGARLLPLARELLTAAQRLRAATQAADSPTSWSLDLGTRSELGLSWLCPALPALRKQSPGRVIHLSLGDTPDLLGRLERGDLDATVASMRLTSPRLTSASLHPEDYLFVSATRCLRRREDAASLTLVDISRDLPLFRYLADALPSSDPWEFREVEYMGGIGNIRRRLLDSPGLVAVLPSYFVRDDLRAKRLVRLLPSTPLRSDAFRLVWRTGHPRTEELLELARQLRGFPLR